MTLEVSHIVANGCSLTYCQGLENPQIDGWPALLAKKIGVPVVNLALGGSSNDGIHRRTYNYFYKSNTFYGDTFVKPLYITSLTYAGRREEFFKQYYGHPDPNRYYCLDLTPNFKKLKRIIDNNLTDPKSIAAYVEYGYFLNFDETTAHIQKLHHWASLVNLFRANGINYVIGEYIPTYNEKALDFAKTHYRDLSDVLFSDKHYIGDFANVTKDCAKLPCGHDDLEAQVVLANYVYNKILEVYGSITVVPIEQIFTLQDFYNVEPPSNLAKSSQWY